MEDFAHAVEFGLEGVIVQVFEIEGMGLQIQRMGQFLQPFLQNAIRGVDEPILNL